jgi:hypothetical protein
MALQTMAVARQWLSYYMITPTDMNMTGEDAVLYVACARAKVSRENLESAVRGCSQWAIGACGRVLVRRL